MGLQSTLVRVSDLLNYSIKRNIKIEVESITKAKSTYEKLIIKSSKLSHEIHSHIKMYWIYNHYRELDNLENTIQDLTQHKTMLTNISLCIVSQTGYFSRLPFFSMIFLEVTNNEALAFWAFLGLLKRDWAVPFFSNDSFFDAMFHIEMLSITFFFLKLAWNNVVCCCLAWD